MTTTRIFLTDGEDGLFCPLAQLPAHFHGVYMLTASRVRGALRLYDADQWKEAVEAMRVSAQKSSVGRNAMRLLAANAVLVTTEDGGIYIPETLVRMAELSRKPLLAEADGAAFLAEESCLPQLLEWESRGIGPL